MKEKKIKTEIIYIKNYVTYIKLYITIITKKIINQIFT